VPIRKGQLIIEYRGEVISHETAMQRMETLYKNRRHSYFLDYEKGEVLDGGSRGTEARFINHRYIIKIFLFNEINYLLTLFLL
jgi:SET domain-containing protein